MTDATTMPEEELPTGTFTTPPEAKGPQAICPSVVREARESLGVITTLLLSSAGTGSKARTFYAQFLMRMHTQFTNTIGGRALETAAVSITDKINFYINPEYWNKQTAAYQMDLVEHEVKHIVFKHIPRSMNYIDTTKNGKGRLHCANIVMDAAINEDLLALHETGVTFAKLNKQLAEIKSRFVLDKNDPWEVNFDKLMQAAKENPEKGGNGEGFGDPTDDHDGWGESTENKEVADGIVRDIANKAQNATGIGNMPSIMLKEIANLNKSTVNWKRELRVFATNAIKYDFTKTRNRRNRRYGVIQPGRKKKPKVRIAACADSSGSVGDEAFAQYFSEMIEIHKMDIEIVVIDADTGVAAVYDFDPKVPFKRYGNGGTAYGPAIQKAVELGVDAIIYFGDMDSSDKPSDPGVPFLWAVVGNQNPPGNFGKTIKVTTERK